MISNGWLHDIAIADIFFGFDLNRLGYECILTVIVAIIIIIIASIIYIISMMNIARGRSSSSSSSRKSIGVNRTTRKTLHWLFCSISTCV